VLAVLVLSLLGAYAGPRPRRPCAPGRYAAVLGCSLMAVLAALATLLAGQRLAGAILVAAAVEGLCLTGWLARHRPGEERPEAQDPPLPPSDPGHFDWDRFERDFRAYDARRDARRPPSRRSPTPKPPT